jgi:hypothetical protein
MEYKFINKFSEYILNETLKTHDINLTIRNVDDVLSSLKYNYKIEKEENRIFIFLFEVSKTPLFKIQIENLNNLMIDRHGWFPSRMIIKNIHGYEKKSHYDQEFLFDTFDYIETLVIRYESKYDEEIKLPDKLYHLSIQQYNEQISKKGLIPKTKNKISNHLDRIYICTNPKDCYNLINQMNLHYSIKNDPKNKKWIIYEIDTNNIKMKIYKDPCFVGGYYYEK